VGEIQGDRGVLQATADGTSIEPSVLWRRRDRGTVTAPKIVLK
jgi:hypothetical protein